MPVVALGAGLASFAIGTIVGRYSKGDGITRKGDKVPKDYNILNIARTPEALKADGKADAVIIVDPFSTGAKLAFEAKKRGYKLIRVLSPKSSDQVQEKLPESCRDLVWDETIQNTGDVAAVVEEIEQLPYHVTACLIGCESGVEFFDALTEAMAGFPSNGTKMTAARRDKYVMGEAVRSAGLRAVKQQECRTWEGDAADFVASLGVLNEDRNGAWCVLKPTKSAATDGVFIAKSACEAQECFHKILGTVNVFNELNQTVLVQEFLKGKEYVVDSVSLEGQHKCTSLWEYDKRPCNEAQFVYFGMSLYQTEDGKREARMVDYVHGVLDAIGVRHGPTHAEVIWLDDEDAPCLVEVGCRPHGGDGTFMEMDEPILGYSQVSVMLDTFDKPYRYHRLPKRPVKFNGLGMEVILASEQEGFLTGYPLLPEVKSMRSFKSCEMKKSVGSRIKKTVDFLTTPGSIMLVHEDRKVVEAERDWIYRMQEEKKFYALEDPM